MKLEKILVPIDGSYVSEVAAGLAIDFAGKFGSKLHFVFIVDTSLFRSSVSPETEKMMIEMEGRIALERISSIAKEKGCDFETIICEGVPYMVLSELSKQYDQIIMAIKGKGSTKFLGSTAERTIENSYCPILTIKAGSSKIDKILLPVSDMHDRAVQLAIDTAKLVHGSITVMSVGRDNADVQGVIDQVAAMVEKEAVPCEMISATGDPADAICAQSGFFDLVIMGTAGRRGIQRILNGSVAEKVMIGASCPVTIIRNGD